MVWEDEWNGFANFLGTGRRALWEEREGRKGHWEQKGRPRWKGHRGRVSQSNREGAGKVIDDGRHWVLMFSTSFDSGGLGNDTRLEPCGVIYVHS